MNSSLFIIQKSAILYMSRVLNIKDPRSQLPDLETPCIIYPTEMGLIPHITPDVDENSPVYISACDVFENSLPTNTTIPKALGLGNRWVFFGPSSEFNNFEEGPSKDSVKIYARNGAIKTFKAEDYQALVDRVKPQGVVCLFSNILEGVSKRQKKMRVQAADQFAKEFEGTITFVSEYAEKNKQCALFAQCGEFTEKVAERLKAEFMYRNEELPRMIMMDGHPDDLRKAISIGFDLFILKLPMIYAKNGIAMTFSFDDKIDELGIDLKSPEYEHDHTPVLEGCDCPCCQHYTKSYLYHLLEVHEMLSNTLLMQHNYYHYEKFIQSIKATIQNQ